MIIFEKTPSIRKNFCRRRNYLFLLVKKTINNRIENDKGILSCSLYRSLSLFSKVSLLGNDILYVMLRLHHYINSFYSINLNKYNIIYNLNYDDLDHARLL
jgi:hypothetical protein